MIPMRRSSCFSLSPIYQHHMVLQRDQPIPLRGLADPDSEVRITLAGGNTVTRAEADGRWCVTLPALPAGGPHELVIACQGEAQCFHDVLIGDIWVCAGQSNMEWSLGLTDSAAADVASATDAGMRFLNVPTLTSLAPDGDWGYPVQWQECDPSQAAAMSAVGYHFARKIREQEPHVPIGLINVAVGGTRIESWLSPEALAAAGSDSEVDTIDGAEFEAQKANFVRGLQRDDRGELTPAETFPAGPKNDCTDWPSMELPCYWQDAGLNHSGIIWFRREVPIPAPWRGKPLVLKLGACDKSEHTFFDGIQIGETSVRVDPSVWGRPREYTIPAALVTGATATIAVRVFSHIFGGGMTGPAEKMSIGPKGESDTPLAGLWCYHVEANFGRAYIPFKDSPGLLWNGMIAPLVGSPIRGILWYQGESNAANAKEYRTLFVSLIEDWRKKWAQRALPFFFVQLPGYGAGENWPELREAQAAALRLPHTGMAVAIDQGEADDVHPRNKREVGKRLAALALRNTYGRDDVTCDGPAALTVRRTERSEVEIVFAHAESLRQVGEGPSGGFEAGGEDGSFSPVQIASVSNEIVRVSGVPATATQIRFGWAAFPQSHLLNRHGLPAAPFTAPINH